MINLLLNEFKNFINSNASHLPPFVGDPSVISETTANVDFDIEDPKRLAQGSSFILQPGAGNATYNNRSARALTFICYDEYLTQFDDNANRYLRCRNIGRADFVAFSAQNDFQYFIVHELSVGGSSKYAKGIKQLFGTIHFLQKDPVVKEFIEQFQEIHLVLTTDSSPAPSPDEMAGGFMEPYDLIPGVIMISDNRFRAFGAKVYETKKVVLP
jgi:hypothetical protein